MADPYAILAELIRSNSEVATFQKDRLTELSTKDFPLSDSKLLIDALRKINFQIIKIFEGFKSLNSQLEEKYKIGTATHDDELAYQELRDDLLTHIKFVWNINTLIYFVEQSAREHVTQSTVYLISYLTREYESNSSFFLTPIQEHNFLYRDLGKHIQDLVKDAIPNSKEILDRLPPNFSILSFPELYRDNIVANILLAHEVGHFIVNVRSLESKVNIKIRIDPSKFNKLIADIASSQISGTKKQSKISDFFEIKMVESRIWESLTGSIQSWVRELLSDMIGFRLAGPVFIVALAEMLLSMFQHGMASERYPPTAYRLQLLLEELDKHKFINSSLGKDEKKITDIITKIRNYITTSSVAINDPVLKLVYDTIDSVKDVIKTIADEATKPMQYTPISFTKDIPILLKKLENLTPPCEMDDGKPSNIISILNAGMIYKLTWMRDNKYASTKREDIEDTERTINDLVLRSIEMSVMHQLMLNHVDTSSKSGEKT